jgi:hypothetical protein
MDRRRAPNVAEFVRACTTGDVETLRTLLQNDPNLPRERVTRGSPGLHLAVSHPDAVRLLRASESSSTPALTSTALATCTRAM